MTEAREASGTAVSQLAIDHPGNETLRVLIAIEDRHCTCREAIVKFLQSRRHHFKVSSVGFFGGRPSCKKGFVAWG